MNMQYYDLILGDLNRRYRTKKFFSRFICHLIAVLGVTSLIYGWRLEPSVTIFRFLTVDGTVFTTVSAIACAVINYYEIVRNVELTQEHVYYLRLSSSVAESVIFIVVMFSQLPIFPEHLPVCDRYDSFVMHVLLPILCVISFLFNDASIGRLGFLRRWHGTQFVTCYAIVIIWLIGSRRLPTELIPYYFLDFRTNGWGVFLLAFAFVYTVAYFISWGISEWNRKLSWIWFKDIARRGKV